MNLFAEIGTHLSGLERLRTMMQDGRLTGIEQTLGLRLVEVEEGRVVVEGTPGLGAYNPFGVVHGGYAAAILDNACGYAAQSRMAPGQACTTLELKVAYHKAMTLDTGPVRAEGAARRLHRGAIDRHCGQTLCVCNIEPDRHCVLGFLRNH